MCYLHMIAYKARSKCALFLKLVFPLKKLHLKATVYNDVQGDVGVGVSSMICNIMNYKPILVVTSFFTYFTMSSRES